ncbi:hypothetical protein [Paractinoplanes durhamensis]|nr:hypothetical protein [Actinoplanes durhamensis]
MRRRILLAAGAAVILAGGVLLVVNRDTATEQPVKEQPVTMRVALTQSRVDEVRRTVAIAMNNDGPAPITVEQAELQAPSFTGVGPIRVDAPLPAGGLRVDVPVAFGTGICAGDELAPRSAASHVAMRVRTADGRVHDVRLALPEHDPILDKLLGLDCRQDYLDRQATFSFGPWTQRPGGRVAGSVVIKRVGFTGTITLREFAGSILLQVLPAPLGARTPKPYAVLRPGTDELTIPIVVDADRCTPHVLAEIKKPYVFPTYVSLDGGEVLYTELRISDADRAAFKPVVDACAKRNVVS